MTIARPLVLFASALVVGGVCAAALARSRAPKTRVRLDTAFGDGGVITFHSLGSPRLDAFEFADVDLAAQHLYVAGNQPAAAVARFDLSGTPDETFGSGGLAPNPLSGALTGICGAGGCVLCGAFAAPEGSGVDGLVGAVRLLPNGSGLDPAFGTDGMLGLGGATDGYAPTGLGHIARDPRDGSYVAFAPRTTGAGFSTWFRRGLIRFSRDGVIDPAFGSHGYAEIDVIRSEADPSNAVHFLRSLRIDSAGRIVVLGAERVTRFLADGTRDAAFGLADADGSPVVVFGLAFDDTDRILGYAVKVRNGLSDGRAAVYRWNADGAPDTTFGSAGAAGRVAFLPRPRSGVLFAHSIAVVQSASGAAPGDRVFLSGGAWFPNNRDSSKTRVGWFAAVVDEAGARSTSAHVYRGPRPQSEWSTYAAAAVAVPGGAIVVGGEGVSTATRLYQSPYLMKFTFDR